MARTLFQEKQSLREVALLWWIILPVSLAIILSLLYGVYWQLVMGEPWGTEPMSDTGLLIMTLVSFTVLTVVLWVLLSVRLETAIDQTGITFQYYPHMRKPRHIPKTEIKTYEVRRLSFFEARRRGYRRSLTGRQQRLLISGRDALIITLVSGKTIVIGTQKPAQLKAALNQSISNHESD